mgnify:CR=1 FL=1
MNLKYISIGALVVILAIFYFINENNKASAERLKQAELDHQKKLIQNGIDEEKSKKMLETQRLQVEKARVMKAEQDKLSSQKQAKEFEQAQQARVESGIKKIEEKVKEMAFDPTSTQFRNQKGNCGEVNGKNRYGGYTGFKKYIYNPETGIVNLEDIDKFYTAEIMQILWDERCS